MGADYATTHQYEPLRTPAGWTGDERRLIVQLTEIFDDLYRRFNRLRFEDLGAAVRSRIEDGESNLSEIRQTATELSAQVSSLDGGVSALQMTTAGLSAAVAGNRLSFTANGLEIKNAAGVTVFQQDAGVGNLVITGNIAATSGTIGGFTIEANALHNGTSIMLDADGFVRLGRLSITDDETLGPVLHADGALTLRVGETSYLLLSGGALTAQLPLSARFGLFVDPDSVTSNPPNAYIDPVTGKIHRSTSTAAAASLVAGISLSRTSMTAGTALTILCTADGGVEPYSYKLAVARNGEGYVTLPGTGATQTYTPAQTGGYRFRVTVSDAQGNQDIAYSEYVTVASADDSLSLTVSASKATLSGPGSVTWSIHAAGGSGSYSYGLTIYKEGERITGVSGNTLTMRLTSPGVYFAFAQVTDTVRSETEQVVGARVTVSTVVAYATTTEANVVIRRGPSAFYGATATVTAKGSYVMITGSAVNGYYPVQWTDFVGYIPEGQLTVVA